jgi:hypothetical protein
VRGRSQRPTAVGDLVARFLSKRYGHPDRAKEAFAMRVFASFARIGPPITEHAEPVALRGGVLTLLVADSAWLTELTFLKAEIIDRVNQGLPKPVVKDVRMRLGAPKKKRVEKAKPPELSREELSKLEKWGAEIPNEEVRLAMMRAAAYVMKRPPSTRKILEGPPGPMPAKKEPAPKPAQPVLVDSWPKDRDRWKK